MKELKKLEEKLAALGKEIEVLKKKDERPMSWEEYCERNYSTSYNKFGKKYFPFGMIPSTNPRYVALQKLELLCKSWGGGYGFSCAIINDRYNGTFIDGENHSSLISFKKIYDAVLFLETFKDLFEEAKELL